MAAVPFRLAMPPVCRRQLPSQPRHSLSAPPPPTTTNRPARRDIGLFSPSCSALLLPLLLQNPALALHCHCQ
ncbi:MAG: hypothetical protein J0L63_20845 [Anaerolineae bacterium]|nr:hypothetical protein [Anaerolineae bacterium]